jgi:gamma-glutamylcyclotransferase (GGCT)/AIG2-like uncharacterized protein YtfP
MSIYYFAYGSNMDPDVMRRLSPHHRFLDIACLPDHRLEFTRRSAKTGTGVADVVPEKGKSVWGTLYEVDEGDLEAIDRKEGYGWAYTRTPMRVRLVNGESREAWVYEVLVREKREVPPSADYVHRLVTAALERGIPDHYVLFLDSLRAKVLQ